MKSKIVKHSVVIITYNQEKLIGRALDSVLCQKEFLYEIVVCDDCSTDNNWDVILEYTSKYSDLIKPFRNLQNLGIFGNIESTWSKISGDIIWYLSGDDEYCNGLFAKANCIINENNIDFENELFTLYFDWKSIDPKGKERVYRNALIKKHDPISLKLRGLICNRTTGISMYVVKRFYPVRKDIGIYADGLIDIQTQLFSNKNYYDSFVGSIYYSGIGIGSKTNQVNRLNSYIVLWEELEQLLENISSKDKSWIKYQKYKIRYQLQNNFQAYFDYFKYYIKSLEPKYGYKHAIIELLTLIKALIKSLNP